MLPSPRLIILLAAVGLLFLAGSIFEPLAALAVLALALVVLAGLFDMLLLPWRRHIEVRRVVPERISLGAATRVDLVVRNLFRRRLTIEVVEDPPEELDLLSGPCKGIFDAGAEGTLSYRLLARRRGAFRLDRLYVRAIPPLGLFYRHYALRLGQDVHVYPNLVDLQRYELMLRRGLLVEQGLARMRQLGQGTEFASLRQYAQGDPLGRVEWKATARTARLVVKDYQPERQQSTLVALDVGRATAGEFEGVSRLDYFVNATMMLAYVVLRQNDWFSLLAFSDRIEMYLPPIRHIRQIDQVARALYKLQPRLVESDYDAACRFMGLRNRKRSLVCLMTDIIDRHANADILAYMARFARTHLPLVAVLRDPQIVQAAERPLAGEDNPHRKAMALDVLDAREEALLAMRQSGVDVLDLEPNDLTPGLIGRYLRIKATRL